MTIEIIAIFLLVVMVLVQSLIIRRVLETNMGLLRTLETRDVDSERDTEGHT